MVHTHPVRSAVHMELIMLPPRNENRCRQRRERGELSSLLVEVRRVQPLPERAIEGRPLRVDGCVPRRVAVAALVDARLAEYAFVREPEPLRGSPRRPVERIAFPLVPPVAELEG